MSIIITETKNGYMLSINGEITVIESQGSKIEDIIKLLYLVAEGLNYFYDKHGEENIKIEIVKGAKA